MLQEEIATVRIKLNFVTNLFMVGSFFIICFIIYLYHIVQSAILFRTYLTAISLIIHLFAIQNLKETNTILLWKSSFIWSIYSLLFFDIRTHITRMYWPIVFLYALFPCFSFKHMYDRSYGIYIRLFFACFVSLSPTLYSNIYGNALYSIVKVLIVIVLLLTEYKEVKSIETYIWPCFAHPLILLLAPLQILYNVIQLLQFKSKKKNKKENPNLKHTRANDIIGSSDVPFLFQKKTTV